ncbi:MAG: FkbM family methyltransferase [Symploca sp. SIO2B6]|nr:FkbM family methyltransferase [Symploca sp. SIO2B6]
MIVVDIGAYDGSAVTIPFAEGGQNIIYAVEPIPEIAKELEKLALPGVTVLNAAVGLEDGEAPFFVNRDKQTSSLLPNLCKGAWEPYFEKLQLDATIQVHVIRLDTFIQQHQIEEIDFLKIDTRGNELNLLKSAGDTLHRIKKITLKVQVVPLYTGSSSKDEIVDYLECLGFRLYHTDFQTEHLEESLEFVRVNRFARATTELNQSLVVEIPFVGSLRFPRNDYVASLLEEGIFEGPEQAFLWLYLRKGDIFFDCGAHVGLFSAIASKILGDEGKVIGFEPHPDIFRLYNDNLSNLGHSLFQGFNVGLSEQDGQAQLYLGDERKSAFSTFAMDKNPESQEFSSSIWVQQRSLDTVLRELAIDTVDFAKLDVEGWEYFVLDGAKESIGAGKLPLWMIEFTEENAQVSGKSTKALRQKLEELGYILCYFNATTLRLEPEPVRDSYIYKNLFAVQDLEEVNLRLHNAAPMAKNYARQLIQMWDAAFSAYSFRQEREILVQRLNFAQEELANAQVNFSKEIEDLGKSIHPLHVQLSDKEALIESIHKQLMDKEELIISNSTQLFEKEALIHQLDAHIKQLNTRLEQAHHHEVSLTASLKRLANSEERDQRIIKNLRTDKKSQKDRLKKITSRLDKVESEKRALEQEVEHLKTGRAALKQVIKALILRVRGMLP